MAERGLLRALSMPILPNIDGNGHFSLEEQKLTEMSTMWRFRPER